MRKMEQIKDDLISGKYDSVLRRLYGPDDSVEKNRKRYENAVNEFEKRYGRKEIEIYSAAGRTEIGGNHTDHQRGKVLAASIDLDAIAVVSKNDAGVIRIKSENYQPFEINLAVLEPQKEEAGTTQALVRGVASGVKKRGYQIGGFEAYITSDVLSGSGLSSSAAFEVLICNVFSGLYNDNALDSVLLAKISQEAERNYFGKPCGLMDQMACSVGGLIYIDFAEEQTPIIKKVEADFNEFGHCICIVDTKGSHADLTDEYAAVPQEMKRVAGYFGKEVLRQVERKQFFESIPAVRAAAGDRAVLRAIHWFEENDRVDAQAAALETGKLDVFKDLVKASGASSFQFLQNVFSVKNIENQGVSIALALSELYLGKKGVCRVHGGGFAGTIQAFVPLDMAEGYKSYMQSIFGAGSCYVLHIRPEGGVRVAF